MPHFTIITYPIVSYWNDSKGENGEEIFGDVRIVNHLMRVKEISEGPFQSIRASLLHLEMDLCYFQ